MLSIFLPAARSKKIVLNHFSYLAEQGYSLSSDKVSNAIIHYNFTNHDDNLIDIKFDIREGYVNLLVIKDNSLLIKLDYELVHFSTSLRNVSEMLKLVQERYKYFWSLKRNSLLPMFEEMVKIYAAYLRPYLC